MIKVSQKGDYQQTKKMLESVLSKKYLQVLNQCGQAGVDALSSATPYRTGRTASSWGYTIEQTASSISIHWTNSNVNDGVNVAIILQYGHATRNGGYVEGIDYINPPLFESMAESVWREVVG